MDTAAAKQTDAKPAEPEKPKGRWGMILTTTPVVLTVLATAFAGLSSSEMTRSMYYRSLAAQHQAKAGDQWAFFQAKRTRGTSLEMTVELLHSLAQPDIFDPAAAEAVSAQILQELQRTANAPTAAVASFKEAQGKLTRLLAEEKTRTSLPFLTSPAMPKPEDPTPAKDGAREALDDVLKAVRQRKTEAETADLVRKLSPAEIEEATQRAEQEADAFDQACAPVTQTIKQLRAAFHELAGAARPLRKAPAAEGDGPALARDLASLDRQERSFQAAALDFEGRRYRQEALYNGRAAELYEVRVRRSGVESDRHRERSQKFFYSMLIAQAGVTIASLALAKAQRSALWLFAALAGAAALAFSAYVYFLS